MSARKRKSTTLTDGEPVAQFINKPTKKPKEYIVDHIVSKRTRKGGREFLIHWEGYGSESDSWEPEANLQPELVSEFLVAEEQFKAQPRTTRGVRKSVDIPATTLTPSKTKRARSNKSDTTDGETPTKQRRTRTPSRTRRPSLSPPRHTTTTTTTTTDQGTLLSPTRGTARAASAKKKVVREEEELTITREYPRPSLLHSRPATTTRTYERTTITTATRSPTSYTATNAVAKAITPTNKNAAASTSTSVAAPNITSPLQVHAGMLVPSLIASATIATLIHLVIGVSMSPGVAKTVLGHLEKVASKSISNMILDRIHYHDVKLLIAVTVPLFVIMHLITRMKSRSIHQTDYTVGVVTTGGIPDTHWTSPKYNHRADTWAAEMIRAIYAFITIVAVLLFWNKEPTWASKQHMEPAFFAITASFAIIDILINHSNMRIPRLIHSLITAGVTTYLTTHTSAVDPVLYQHLFHTFLLIVLAEAERAGSVAFGGLLYPMTSYIYQLLYIVGTPLLGAWFYSTHDGKKPVEASMATAVLVTQAFTSIMDQYLTQPKKVTA